MIIFIIIMNFLLHNNYYLIQKNISNNVSEEIDEILLCKIIAKGIKKIPIER